MKAAVACLLLACTSACIANHGDVDLSFGGDGSNAVQANTFAMLATPGEDHLVSRGMNLDRLNAQGVTVATVGLPAWMTAIAVLPDGDIVLSRVAGTTSLDRTVELCRYRADLTPVMWGEGGNLCVSAPLPHGSDPCSVTTSVATESQIFVGGTCGRSFIAAFTSYGMLDTGFAGGLKLGIWNDTGDKLALLVADPGGSGVMAGGSAFVTHEFNDGTLRQSVDFALAALTPYGDFRGSFALTGKRTVGFDDLAGSVISNDSLTHLVVESQRIMLIGVSDGTYPGEGIKRMVALKLNGDRDNGFTPSASLASLSNLFLLQSAAGDANVGYFLVGRWATVPYPFTTECVALRIGRDGAVDTNFGGGLGYSRFTLPGSPLYVSCQQVQVLGCRPFIAESSGFVGSNSAVGRLTIERIFGDNFEGFSD